MRSGNPTHDMRLRLRLIDDHTGAEIRSAIVANMFAVRGQDELAAFAGVSMPAFEVSRVGQGYTVRLEGREVLVETYAAIPLAGATLHCTMLRQRSTRFDRGRCPRCGAALHSRQQGGAYRAAATSQRHCPSCEVEVLTLADLAGIGQASGVGGGWLHVVSPLSCPTCGESMVPGTLSANGARVGVEACGPCNVVVVEPEDRVVLLAGGD